MKTVLLLAISFCSVIRVSAQSSTSTLNTSGGNAKSGTISLEWSIGEMTAIQTLHGPDCILTQGLLQPGENTSLPIHLLFFTANIEQNKTKLEWQTINEVNSSAFEIHFSADALNFKKIGMVAAAGNSNAARDYLFYHTPPVAGRIYYRLKMLDLDGNYKYSPTVLVINEIQAGIMIYPNPIREKASIKLDFPPVSPRAKLMDGTGKFIKWVNLSPNGTTELEMRRLASGIYYLSVETKSGVVIKKIFRY